MAPTAPQRKEKEQEPVKLRELQTRASGILPSNAPAKAFGFAYANPEEASVKCPTCGEEPTPRPLTRSGMWARGACKCLRENMERKHKQYLAEVRRAVLQEQLYQCYGWMGKSWDQSALGSYTFETFQPLKQPDAWEVAQAWVQNPTGTPIFFGGYGLGKTHLMAAMCNVMIKSGYKCRWCSAVDLFLAVGHEMNTVGGDWTKITGKAATSDVLFLDDVDKGRPSEFRHEVYKSIFDRRSMERKPTVLSINNLSKLGEYMSEAVEDRLYIGRLPVEFTGESFRKSLAYM